LYDNLGEVIVEGGSIKGKMKKLICDRCGFELSDRWDILAALDVREAWENAVRARGAEPRGVFPCKYYIRCQGEMLMVNSRREFEKIALAQQHNS
jgi:hypothetical protein